MWSKGGLMFWMIMAVTAVVLFTAGIFAILVVISAAKLNEKIVEDDGGWMKRQGIM